MNKLNDIEITQNKIIIIEIIDNKIIHYNL